MNTLSACERATILCEDIAHELEHRPLRSPTIGELSEVVTELLGPGYRLEIKPAVVLIWSMAGAYYAGRFGRNLKLGKV